MASPLKVYLLVGERSGDTHGADLVHALQKRVPDVEIRGMGGPKLVDAVGGDGIEDWVEEAGVVGLAEVLKKYGYFKAKMSQVVDDVMAWQPDVVVPVDYPGFNLRLAKALRKRGFDGKIVYYISPQVWAWNQGRIPKMAKMLDRMLCIFPFEKALYEKSGLATDFVGHPLVDKLEEIAAAPVERDERMLGLFPGSRMREVDALFGDMVGAVERMRKKLERDDWRVVAAAASEKVAAPMRAIVSERGLQDLIDVQVGTSRELMQRSTLGAVASGTATLEAAVFGMPYCLVYRVAPLTFLAAKLLMKVPYLGIVNILADRQIVAELLQGDLSADSLAGWFEEMVDQPQKREELQRELRAVIDKLGTGGAAERAADAIVAES
ncbi:lipid-A-disaccharide synthase [Sulfuriroseicoccus oceanibius]|uniref:Lipid-A-disaccharide synthase n=1 Tax=Sulfuriroseicoccus oceanibius TaxID=2707525 RepID=A0A7T7EZE0_9BACT|nr:lipid-A-disaccharide synthase [Sulfuriroseicoccus oceanibius]QQL43997.1 lipid-A-disaccharide synthase [Sulfuriroseicoccus oceanibius]